MRRGRDDSAPLGRVVEFTEGVFAAGLGLGQFFAHLLARLAHGLRGGGTRRVIQLAGGDLAGGLGALQLLLDLFARQVGLLGNGGGNPVRRT